MMQVQVNFGSIESSSALEDHVRTELESAIGRFEQRLTRIEAHLHDDNSPAKAGSRDKRCTLEARPAGMQPVSVEDEADDIYDAVRGAASKLKRALAKRLQKD